MDTSLSEGQEWYELKNMQNNSCKLSREKIAQRISSETSILLNHTRLHCKPITSNQSLKSNSMGYFSSSMYRNTPIGVNTIQRMIKEAARKLSKNAFSKVFVPVTIFGWRT